MSSIIKSLKKRFASASATPAGTGITIPRNGTGGGGEYGADITDQLRTFAITREPVAYRAVFSVAKAIFDNWFTLEGSNYRTPNIIDDNIPTSAVSAESEKGNDKFNRRVQKLLEAVNAKEVFTRMATYERGYGWAIIVLGYEDNAPTLIEPVTDITGFKECVAYGPPQISKVEEEKDPNSERYGLPLIYHITRSGTSDALKVHYTRVIHFATRLIDHEWKGKSVLDPAWDDLTVLRNIRWGMGQTMYRYGSGFPDITFTGAEDAQIKSWIDEGNFADLSARTFYAHNEDAVLEFKGTAGHALDPMNYYLPPMEHISCATGIPLAILRGVQAGALTGSQTDTANLWSMISGEQSAYEAGIREFIKALVGREVEFTFNWQGGFELDEQTKAQIELTKAQTYDYLWNFETRNEIRRKIDPELPMLSDEEGGKDLKTKSNGPEPEVEVNPLTGQPNNDLFGNKRPNQQQQLQEQISQGDASYLITEVSKPRTSHAGSGA